MQIVIDINDEDFEIIKGNVKRGNPLSPMNQESVMTMIANGTPLDDIKAEIIEMKVNSGLIAHKVAYRNCLEVIDKHTSGKEKE